MHSSRLSFEDIGSGLPVLAIHGWGVDHRTMTCWLEPLLAGRIRP